MDGCLLIFLFLPHDNNDNNNNNSNDNDDNNYYLMVLSCRVVILTKFQGQSDHKRTGKSDETQKQTIRKRVQEKMGIQSSSGVQHKLCRANICWNGIPESGAKNRNGMTTKAVHFLGIVSKMVKQYWFSESAREVKTEVGDYAERYRQLAQS